MPIAESQQEQNAKFEAHGFLNAPGCGSLLFKHEELSSKTSSIRLLSILPSSTRRQLHCSIRQVLRHDPSCPDYTALSYTWGNGADTRRITLNGEPFEIRRNLWNLLSRIRDYDRVDTPFPHTFWADAICIDQSNVAERDAQVRIMTDIFSDAQHVLAWLGPLDGELRRSLRSCFASFQQDLSLCKQAKRFRRRSGTAKEPATLHTTQTQSDTIAKAMPNICSRQYWNRMWIVQEFLFAQELSICLGNDIICWSMWYRILISTGELNSRGSFVSALPGFGLTKLRGPETASRPRTPFAQLIKQFKGKACSDPRDKVFVLLGVAGVANSFAGSYADDELTLFYKTLAHCGTDFEVPRHLYDALNLQDHARRNEAIQQDFSITGTATVSAGRLGSALGKMDNLVLYFGIRPVEICVCHCNRCRTSSCWLKHLDRLSSWTDIEQYLLCCSIPFNTPFDRDLHLLFEPMSASCLSSINFGLHSSSYNHSHELRAAVELTTIDRRPEHRRLVLFSPEIECRLSHGLFNPELFRRDTTDSVSFAEHTDVAAKIKFGRSLVDALCCRYASARSIKGPTHVTNAWRHIATASIDNAAHEGFLVREICDAPVT